MASLNKVMLIGHLGRDPETRYSAGGDAVTNASLATTDKWTDKASGEQKEATEWHRLVFFKRQAEIAGEYLKKGSQIYVEGKLVTRKWTDKQGAERYTTEIRVEQLVMLGAPGAQLTPGKDYADVKGGARVDRGPQPAQASTSAPARKQGAFDDMTDDIPF